MLQTMLGVALLLSTCLLVSTVAHDPLVVDTSTGKLRGYRVTSRSGRQFMAFSGVPYAKPPVGPLRFQPPEEPARWNGIRDATDQGAECLQYGLFEAEPKVTGSEDCLFLQVYTHSTRGRAAVMVHFHAGGFYIWNGPRYTLPHYMMDQDVVVVDVNYRLSYLGFLSFEDKDMPGNQGLKDQVMALRWVKKNIAKFGGDPNKVTLVGESAGGTSVHHHTVSPLSRGLFHRGIAESGTSYTPFSVAAPGFAKGISQQLAKNLGCPIHSTVAAVNCLRSKDGSEIVTRVQDLKIWQGDLNMTWPCLEPEGHGAFLTGPVSRWQHQPVPMIIGQTSAEGLLRTYFFYEEKTDFKWLSDNFDRLAPLLLMYAQTASDPAEVTKKIRQYYFPGGEITPDLWFNLTQMFTDSWFGIGIMDAANLHPGDVYFYYFDYIGEFTYPKDANRTILFGAPHIEEAEYLWQRPWTNRTFKGNDLKLSNKLVKFWTDFAKYGNPTPRGSSISWRKWNPQDSNYLLISNSGIEQKEGLAKDRYKFWKSINYRDKLKI